MKNTFGKIIFTLFAMVLLFGFTTNASAGFGIKGGSTSSEINLEVNNMEVDGLGKTSGFVVGFFFPNEVNDYYTFQPEILYVQKGASQTTTGTEFTMNYITVPLLFKFLLPINNTIYPNFYFGPYAGYLVNIEVDDTRVKAADIKDFDVGVTAGAGFDIKVGGHKITFEGRYERGLINIADTS